MRRPGSTTIELFSSCVKGPFNILYLCALCLLPCLCLSVSRSSRGRLAGAPFCCSCVAPFRLFSYFLLALIWRSFRFYTPHLTGQRTMSSKYCSSCARNAPCLASSRILLRARLHAFIIRVSSAVPIQAPLQETDCVTGLGSEYPARQACPSFKHRSAAYDPARQPLTLPAQPPQPPPPQPPRPRPPSPVIAGT